MSDSSVCSVAPATSSAVSGVALPANTEKATNVSLGRAQVEAPVDRRRQRALAARKVAWADPNRVHAAAQPPREIGDREQRQPRCGQLDRERQPIETGADVGDRARLALEPSPARARSTRSEAAPSGDSGSTR